MKLLENGTTGTWNKGKMKKLENGTIGDRTIPLKFKFCSPNSIWVINNSSNYIYYLVSNNVIVSLSHPDHVCLRYYFQKYVVEIYSIHKRYNYNAMFLLNNNKSGIIAGSHLVFWRLRTTIMLLTHIIMSNEPTRRLLINYT